MSAVERPHHSYSPSTLQSLEACPGYLSRQDKTPHVRTTAGTKAHGVAESGVDDNSLSDEDALAAAECLDFVELHRKLMGDNVLEVKEAYLPIDDLDTTAGYIDHGLIAGDRKSAKLFDWKFGMWPVEDASNNLQGIAYALGLARAHPSLDSIEFFFKQPHLNSITSAVFRREQFPALYLRIQVVVARARAARAAIATGDWSAARPYVPICNFCANIGRCEAVSKFACNVGHKFHPLAIPENVTPSMIHSSRDTVLGLALAQVLSVWAKAFKTQITDRIIRGEADMPEGQVLQQRSDREIANAELYKSVALRYVTPIEYESACTVGFGKIEDAIKEKSPRGQKKAALESFNAELVSSGAIVQGQPYTFLRAIPEKSTDNTTSTKESNS